MHLICSGALINELAGGIGDKVGNGSGPRKRRTGGFGKGPCGGVHDIDVYCAIGAGSDRNVDEVLARADKNFIGKNGGAQAEKSLHACCGGDLKGSREFTLPGSHKAPHRVGAERASTVGRPGGASFVAKKTRERFDGVGQQVAILLVIRIGR